MNQSTYRRLYRSRKNRIVAGVCGGLSDYFNVDPTWVRLLFILFFLLGGCSFLIYIIMWLIVPSAPE